MAKDAPRALSDAFLALAAALFLGSDWMSFCSTMLNTQSSIGQCLARLVKKVDEHPDLPGADVSILDPLAHLKSLAAKEHVAAHVQLLSLPSRTNDKEELETMEDALDTVRQSSARDPHRGHTFHKMVLLPLPTRSGTDVPSHIHVAAGLRDFHCARLWIGGFAVGPFVLAASPRSAVRRCAAFALQGIDGEAQTEKVLRTIRELLESGGKDCLPERSELSKHLLEFNIGSELRCKRGTGDDTTVFDAKGQLVSLQDPGSGLPLSVQICNMFADAPLYCGLCDKTLTGPNQFEAHRNGKKHKAQLAKHCGHGSREIREEDENVTTSNVDAPREHERESTAKLERLPSTRWPASGGTNAAAVLHSRLGDAPVHTCPTQPDLQWGGVVAEWAGVVPEINAGHLDEWGGPASGFYNVLPADQFAAARAGWQQEFWSSASRQPQFQ